MTNDKAGGGMTRVQKIEFLALASDKTRTLEVGNLGTTCLPNACIARGAEIYELMGKNEIGKIDFDQLGADEILEAGHPYIMRATSSEIKFYNTVAPAVGSADDSGALKGTFTEKVFAAGEESANLYFLKERAFWAAETTGMTIPAYRAWLKMDDVQPTQSAVPAPGRKRISLGVQGENVATGIGNVQGDEVQSSKVLINGQLFILRGEKMYDAIGRRVK